MNAAALSASYPKTWKDTMEQDGSEYGECETYGTRNSPHGILVLMSNQ